MLLYLLPAFVMVLENVGFEEFVLTPKELVIIYRILIEARPKAWRGSAYTDHLSIGITVFGRSIALLELHDIHRISSQMIDNKSRGAQNKAKLRQLERPKSSVAIAIDACWARRLCHADQTVRGLGARFISCCLSPSI